MMPRPGRTGNLLGAAACFAMLGFALYAEKVLGLAPCPLCMFQRVGILALGVVFTLAALHHPGRAGRRVYATLIVAAAGATLAVAARHVYVQSLPPGTVPACGASLDFMLEVFPLLEVVRKVMTGGGECAQVDWRFLGLSMPAWVLVATGCLGVYGAAANSERRMPR
ncbi:MAG: disulfide bond formation protein B [Steroidobacteraceae bacterium]